MRAIISYLILPIPIFIILILISLFLSRIKKKRKARLFLWIAGVWFLLITTPFMPNLLISGLEGRYEMMSVEELAKITSPVNILILGSGHADDERLQANAQLSETALARLTEGIRLYRQLPGSKIITSGFNGLEENPNAKIVAKAAVLLGVDPLDISSQALPEKTADEAEQYKKLYGANSNLILVTSAAHMPRSIYLFKKAGLNPTPAPTDFMYKKRGRIIPRYWLPDAYNIRILDSAIHEYVGLVYSWITK